MTKFRVKPTMKENWRYIAFELISEKTQKEQDVVKSVISSVLKLFGTTGASETNVWLIEFNAAKQNGLLRCSNKALQKVLAAVTTITKIDEKKTVMNVLGVSGTIKKAKGKFLS